MKNTIVTSGKGFTDIDALACAVAYVELLKLEGKQAEAVLPGSLNHSITAEVLSWGIDVKTAPSSESFETVVVDVSEIEFFPSFAREDSVAEVYDHHFGREDFWKQRLGKNSHIEPVGACATLIWEEFCVRGYAERISETSARLLAVAIVSNTLNFRAQITNERDVIAYKDLAQRAHMPPEWIERYFLDQERAVMINVGKAIRGDTKVVHLTTIPFDLAIGQMELWNGASFIDSHAAEIMEALESFECADWILSIPSIGDGKNYLYTESERVRALFKEKISAHFDGSIGVTEKLWLRKEILREFLG